MRVLLAIDGSPHSDAAVADVVARLWPTGTTVQILTVIHPAGPMLPDPALLMAAIHAEQAEGLRHRAPALVEAAADRIRHAAPDVVVVTKIVEGAPKDLIVEEAREWDADLVVLGSRGHGRLRRMVLGSVAGAVVANAPCSVQVVRAKHLIEGDESAASRA